MIESKNDASKNLEKALQALEQAKQRVAPLLTKRQVSRKWINKTANSGNVRL